MMDAMCREVEMRHDFLHDRQIDTIYFGGGTPSLLKTAQLSRLLDSITHRYQVRGDVEITLEANPDDINPQILQDWKSLGINRLSIGIQTFDQSRLHGLNRAHNRTQALESIEIARAAGFDDLNGDLIYAIPPEAMQIWQQDLETMIAFQLPHLSIYSLTVEENTVFGRWQQSGKFEEVSEDANAEQYAHAIERLKSAGYEHYEVSNFCLPGRRSRHNSSYWLQKQYLGIGPGAHSYNGSTRAITLPHNAKYISSLSNEQLPVESEELTPVQITNEYIMTRIRTTFGIDRQYLEVATEGRFSQQNSDTIAWLIEKGWMVDSRGTLMLTSAGMFQADEIALKLFLEN